MTGCACPSAGANQAIQAYRAALAVAPDNPDGLLGLGSALVKVATPTVLSWRWRKSSIR
jgi:cytochrome c-type biogenesis protein CcmH/NrfG